MTVFICIVSEGTSLFYSYFIGNMIRFLQDPKIEQRQGFVYVGIYFAAQLIAVVMRNHFVMNGFGISIRVRKLLVGALYDKTIGLSVKSMAETNSGKLISLINGDLF